MVVEAIAGVRCGEGGVERQGSEVLTLDAAGAAICSKVSDESKTESLRNES